MRNLNMNIMKIYESREEVNLIASQTVNQLTINSLNIPTLITDFERHKIKQKTRI